MLCTLDSLCADFFYILLVFKVLLYLEEYFIFKSLLQFYNFQQESKSIFCQLVIKKCDMFLAREIHLRFYL